ncbi:MAG: hypothetical protein ACM3ZA_07645 [Bacillota bacterium]
MAGVLGVLALGLVVACWEWLTDARPRALGVLALVGLGASLLAGFSLGPLFLVPTLLLFLSAAAGIRNGPGATHVND